MTSSVWCIQQHPPCDKLLVSVLQSPAKLAAAASPPRGLHVQRGSGSSAAAGMTSSVLCIQQHPPCDILLFVLQSPAKLAAAASPPRGLHVQRGSGSSAAAGMTSSGVDVLQAVRKLPGAAATDGSQAMYETVPGEWLILAKTYLGGGLLLAGHAQYS
jgi:hypothetical protein